MESRRTVVKQNRYQMCGYLKPGLLNEPIMLRGVERRRLPRAPVKLALDEFGLELQHVEFSEPDKAHAHCIGEILLPAAWLATRAALALRHDFLDPFELGQLCPAIRCPHQIRRRINEPAGEQ